MSFIAPLIDAGRIGAADFTDFYKVPRSMRLNAPDAPQFMRVQGLAPTSTKKATFSSWLRQTELGAPAQSPMFYAYDGSVADAVGLEAARALRIYFAGSGPGLVVSTAKFLD